MTDASSEGLRRELGLGAATSLVVGIAIGSGIFIGSNRAAQGVSEPWMLLGLWVVGGLLTLMGALTYAELGALYPRSGGDYVYAREGLGRFWAFFSGWSSFSINYPASIAAIGLAAAGQLEQLKPGLHATLFSVGFSLKFSAVALIALFVIVNYLGVRHGGRAQSFATLAKVVLIGGLVALVLSHPATEVTRLGESGGPPTASLAVAFVGILWAYDGWAGVARVAGEVKDARRTLPMALIGGIVFVILVYVLLNVTYLGALGLDGMRGTGLDGDDAAAVASRAASALYGGAGNAFVSLLILISVLATLNGLTLAGSRIYFAMARDGLFLRALARVHPRTAVPHVSLLFQGAISAVLALFFDFNQLTSYVILASWIGYALASVALIRLRWYQGDAARPYRVPGYPATPILFLLLSGGFVVYLVASPFQDPDPVRWWGLPKDFVLLLSNLVVLLLAVPLYAFVRRQPGTSASAPA